MTGDAVSLTNINRQIIALEATVGRLKVEAARERVLGINPACRWRPTPCFLPRKTRRAGGLFPV